MRLYIKRRGHLFSMHVGIVANILLFAAFTLPNSWASERVRNQAEFSALCWFLRISNTAEWALTTDNFKHLAPESLLKRQQLLEWLQQNGSDTLEALEDQLDVAFWYLNETERHAARRMYQAFDKRKSSISELQIKIQEKANQSRQILENISILFRAVRYGDSRKGETSEEWIDNVYTKAAQRNRTCNMKNSDPSQPRAGSSLVNDLLCLCAVGDIDGGDHNEMICGIELDPNSTWTDASGFTPYTAGQEWNRIWQGCMKLQDKADLTVENLQGAIDHFESLLGTNAREVDPENDLHEFQWVLGYAGTGWDVTPFSVCSASSYYPEDALGQCVNYANETGDERGNIAWLQTLQEILAQLRTYEDIHREVEYLEREVDNIGKDMEEEFELSGLNYQEPSKPQSLLFLLLLT
ncbi:Variant surface glycoprotein [Trypanosoma congolense IL3000]|uniref:Variant surface glycoprotein n=1 Tax=Trypanosoma congolense (strain IL3000) TaxID=1068625 RepID=F9WDJ8_TRYCI|nr:Variant surface glycoprotein [Trypanosoma congolense IL3000]